MPLVQGINHAAVVTGDLDRLAAFYCEMFDVPLVLVDDTPFGRIGIVKLGPGVGLNLFEIAGNEHATGLPTMFGRGHLDHLGVQVTDRAAFDELRSRLVGGGYSTGEISDFGPVIGFEFTDPDGMHVDVDLVLDPDLTGAHEPRPYVPADAAVS